MIRLFLALCWLTQPVQAACEEEGAQALLTALNSAEKAHAELDISALQAGAQAAVVAVGCADAIISVDDAARLHRVVGLEAFTQQEREVATRAFAAARSADPSYDFPLGLVPEGHPLRTYYGALPLDAGSSQPIQAPVEHDWVLDGMSARLRPLSWPTLAQLVGPTGGIISTHYLWPEDAWPEALSQDAGAVPGSSSDTQATAMPGTDSETRPPGKRNVRKPLLGVSLLSAVVAGGTYLGAGMAERSYDERGHTPEELNRLFLLTNGLTVSSTVFGVLAVGTGVGAILSRSF